MIENIAGQGFKGLDFDQPLAEKNLFVGPNGAGKSARTNALQLMISGYVPGVGKKNADILAAFGVGDKLLVSGKINDAHFTRRFCRDKKGAVSQDFLVERRKATKTKFIEAMAKAHAPVVLDLDAVFLSLSDQKKIDYLFSLFPPAGDVGSLDEEIESMKEVISATNKDYTAKQVMVKQLTMGKCDIKLPAGTLAETKAEIEKVTADYKEKSAALAKVREDLAAEKAKEEADAKAKADKIKADAKVEADKITDAEKAKEDQDAAVETATNKAVEDTKQKILAKKKPTPAAIPKSYPKIPDEIADKPAAAKALAKVERIAGNRPELPSASKSIRRIMTVAEKVDALAVVIACKKELKIWEV